MNSRRRLLLLLLVVAGCTVPFLDKPFHIDDPFYVWTAEQIQKTPLDPYNYTLNWYGADQRASEIAFSPPLFSYALALWGGLFGLQEISCHALNVLIAMMVAIGIFRLAKEWGCEPFAAAVVSVASPLFVMCATSVMCDLLMLAFWLFALLAWLKALRTGSSWHFLTASLLACACALTKFNGVFALVLMGLSSVLERRRLEPHLLWLALPCLALFGYSLWFASLYNANVFHDMFAFISANRSSNPAGTLRSAVASVVFAGGVVAAGFPFLFRSLRRKETIAVAATTLLLEGLFLLVSDRRPVLWVLQHVFWMFGGIALLWLGVRQAVSARDKVGILLVSWLALGFLFPLIFNWGTSGRSLVALIPVVGLVAVRVFPAMSAFSPQKTLLQALPMLCCAVLVAWSDFEMASVNKRVAVHMTSRFNAGDPKERTLWFQGHWGFQYYMQRGGAKALNIWSGALKENDLLVLPLNNADITPPAGGRFLIQEELSVPYALPLSVMNKRAGAGYHSYYWGDLPFVFGMRAVEPFIVLRSASDQPFHT